MPTMNAAVLRTAFQGLSETFFFQYLFGKISKEVTNQTKNYGSFDSSNIVLITTNTLQRSKMPNIKMVRNVFLVAMKLLHSG